MSKSKPKPGPGGKRPGAGRPSTGRTFRIPAHRVTPEIGAQIKAAADTEGWGPLTERMWTALATSSSPP